MDVPESTLKALTHLFVGIFIERRVWTLKTTLETRLATKLRQSLLSGGTQNFTHNANSPTILLLCTLCEALSFRFIVYFYMRTSRFYQLGELF